MSKYIIARNNDKGQAEFLQELHGEDAYTDDLGHALQFDSEYDATRERIDDEHIAELGFDIEGAIVGYRLIPFGG